MKFINLLCLTLSLYILFSLPVSAQNKLIYSRVLLKADDTNFFNVLAENGVYIDHAKPTPEGYIAVLDENDISRIEALDIPHKVLIENMEKYQAKRFEEEMKDPVLRSRINSKEDGFTLGNYAGYNNIAQLYQKMIEISTNYPDIAAERAIIGRTYQNRPIYMMKISDNPGIDESATEPVVYYDAMHHAREPLSMMITLYYMFWLVENYGIDSTATHIVNNRELYFVPLVNPDGYAYNVQTSPSGGFWRKTRTPDPYGGACIGTDPNRNYDIDWYSNGSDDPCSQVFRGEIPFSEPCTQAIRGFVTSINPVMAFSSHSSGEVYLEAGLYGSSQEEFYGDYSLDICAANQLRYNTVGAGGLTMQFLNSIGTIAWLPETGDEFYVPAAQIIPYAQKHLPSFIKLAQIAGEYPDIKQATINQGNNLLPDGIYSIDVEIFNKGKELTAENMQVMITNISENASIVNGTATVADIDARQLGWSDTNMPLQISLDNTVSAGDIIELDIAVVANGIEYENETQKWIVGAQNVLFAEDGINGMASFDNYGYNSSWDITDIMRRSGDYCFTDSKYGDNYDETTQMRIANPIDLSNTTQPILEFWMAWGLSNSTGLTPSNFDASHCILELRTNNGEWEAVATDDTQIVNGEPRFILNKPWSKQIIDLSNYIGSMVEFRFTINSDFNFFATDGVFIDDIRVVDYKNNTATLPAASINEGTITSTCEGVAVNVSHSSDNYTDFMWTTSNGLSSSDNPASFTFNTAGTYAINLQVNNDVGSDEDYITVLVVTPTPVSFTVLPNVVSLGENISLSATPPGGTFSGDGIIFNNFDSDLTGVGLHTITYSYTDAANCTSEVNSQILVYSILYNFVDYQLNTIDPKITNQSELVIHAAEQENYTIRLFDLSGKLLVQENVAVQKGIQHTGKRIFKNLDRGLYIFSISNNREVLSEKVFVE